MAENEALATAEATREGENTSHMPTATQFSYCTLPNVPVREFGPDVAPGRIQLIRVFGKKWVNGTVLCYYFFDQDTDGENVQSPTGSSTWRTWVGADEQRAVVRRAFQMWKDVGIGLEFREVQSRDEAELRIGFMQGDGSWSYVGRDAIDLDLSVNERTMNFGWSLTRSADEIDTAIHEIGHALGFPHEHQNPNAGIVWDEEAVYRLLAQPPNGWSRETTHYNILRKIPADTVQGSNWDPDSIMHYAFQPGLILEPERYRNGLTPAGSLSARDREWVRTFYPPLRRRERELKLLRPEVLDQSPSRQTDLVIHPTATRRYTIQTFGISDTVMVLFEEIDGTPRYMAGDDDSGIARNAKLGVRMISGRKYVLRVRLSYNGGPGMSAVMMW